MATYLVGNAARVSTRFRSVSTGADVDPTTVTARIKNPNNVETAYVYGVDNEVVRDAAGYYHIDVPLTLAGTWRYRWEGTGANMAASEGALTVTASTF